jgi:hypothetical protein
MTVTRPLGHAAHGHHSCSIHYQTEKTTTITLFNQYCYDMHISLYDPNCCAIMFSRSRSRSGPGTGGTVGSPCSASQL